MEVSGGLGALDIGHWTSTHLARIEVGADEIKRLFEDDAFAEIATALKKIGYAHVTLDLQGYRRGSMNEAPIQFGKIPQTAVK